MLYLSKLAKRLALAGPQAGLLCAVLVFAGGCATPEEREFLSPNPNQPNPVVSLTVEPRIGSARPGEVIQFSATARNAKGATVSADVDWSATGGTITPAGQFVSEVYGQFTVTARLRANVTIADSARVGVFVNPKDVLKIAVSPNGQEVSVGEGLQLEATAELADGSVVVQPPLAWSAPVGQVDGTGYFIAPETEGVYVVKALAPSGVSGTANIAVKASRRVLERVVVSPSTATLSPDQAQVFTAVGVYDDGSTKSVPIVWSSTGGTIGGDGTYTAGSTPGNYRVIGRFKQGTQADTAFVSITEPQIVGLDVAPGASALVTGATQQYVATARMSDGSTKSVGATWSATGGSINAAGLYSATTNGSFKVKAGVAGTSVTGEADVTVSAPAATLVSLILNPSSATVPAGGERQFTVTGTWSDGSTQTPQVTWTATGGAISAAGDYVAGTTQGTFRVIATSGGKADTSDVTVGPAALVALSISPDGVTLPPGVSQTFTASGTWSDGSTTTPVVAWSAEGGTITSGGVYTAGTVSGTFRVIGTHSGGLADTSLVTVAPPAPTLTSLTLSPATVSVAPSGSIQFSATGTWSDGGSGAPAVTWSATGGTVSGSGLYTAGTGTGTFQVIARHTGGTLADTAVVTITAAAPTLTALVISPKTTSLQTSGSRQFTVTATWSDGSTALPAVTWSTTGGTVSAAGLYVAPGTAGTYLVVAKQTGGIKADTGTVTVTSAATVVGLTVSPGTASLGAGSTQQFTASATYSNGGTGTTSLTWAATGGTISSGGLYTAPGTSGQYKVIAQASGTTVRDTADVTAGDPTQITSVAITPDVVTLGPSATQQFTVVATSADGQTRPATITYMATGGSISSSGLFTAGTLTGQFLVVASCTCGVADTSRVTISLSSQVPAGNILNVNFDNGSWGGLSPWGTPSPTIITDPTALGGRSVQMSWTGGTNNNRGVLVNVGTRQKVHVRFRYKLPSSADISGIMKLIRFRGPGDKAVGTIDIQWSKWLHWTDDFSDMANHFATGSTPEDCRAKWCWVEASMDYSTGTSGRARLWINGIQVLDYTRTGISYTGGISSLYLWGYFNSPADERVEWIDEVAVGTDYIGVPN